MLVCICGFAVSEGEGFSFIINNLYLFMTEMVEKQLSELINRNYHEQQSKIRFPKQTLHDCEVLKHIRSHVFQELKIKTLKIYSEGTSDESSQEPPTQIGAQRDQLACKNDQIGREYAMIPLMELPMLPAEGKVCLGQFKPSSVRNYCFELIYQLFGDEVEQWQQKKQWRWSQVQALNFYRAGNYFNKAGRHQLSIWCYRRALSCCPALYQASNNLASIYYLFCLQEMTLQLLESAISKGTRKEILINNLALQWAKKDCRRAIEEIKTAVSLKPNFPSLYNLALLYLQTAQFEPALHSFTSASQIQENKEVLMGLGVSLTLLTRFKEALKYFGKVPTSEQDGRTFLMNKGYASYEAGDLDAALRCFQKGMNLYPDEAHFYFGMGIVTYDLGTTKECYQYFQRAKTMSCKAVYHSHFVVFLIKTKQIQQALRELDQLLERKDLEGEINIIQILNLLIQAQVDQSKVIHILDSFMPSLRFEIHKIYNKKACLLANIGHFQPALEWLFKAVEVQKDPIILLNIGFVFFSIKKYAMSFTCFQECLNTHKGFSQGYYHLGYLYAKFQHYPEALELFLTFLKLVPRSPEGLNAVGVVKYYMGEEEQATGYFDQALAICPSYKYSLNNKAIILGKTGRLIGIDFYFHYANMITNPVIQYNKALALETVGELDKAKRLYYSILQQRPEFPQALHNLGFVFLKRKKKEVFTYIRKAILSNPYLYKSYVVFGLHCRVPNQKKEDSIHSFVSTICTTFDPNYKISLNIAVLYQLLNKRELYLKWFQEAFVQVARNRSPRLTRKALTYYLELLYYLQKVSLLYKHKQLDKKWNTFHLAISYIQQQLHFKDDSTQQLQQYLAFFKGQEEVYHEKTVMGIAIEISPFQLQTQRILSEHVAEYFNRTLLSDTKNRLSALLIEGTPQTYVCRTIIVSTLQNKEENYSVNGSDMQTQFLDEKSTENLQTETHNKYVRTEAQRREFRSLSPKHPAPNSMIGKQGGRKERKSGSKYLAGKKAGFSRQQKAERLIQRCKELQEREIQKRIQLVTKLKISFSPTATTTEAQILHQLIFFKKVEVVKHLSKVKSQRFVPHSYESILNQDEKRWECLSLRSSPPDFVYTAVNPPGPLKDYLVREVVQTQHELQSLIKEISDIFSELEHHNIHHPCLSLSLLSKTAESSCICNCFEDAFIVLSEEENECPESRTAEVTLLQVLLTFWLTVQSFDCDEIVFSTIFKGLPKGLTQELREIKQQSLLEKMISPLSFQEKLKKVRKLAVVARKVDHWNQFRSIVEEIVELRRNCDLDVEQIKQWLQFWRPVMPEFEGKSEVVKAVKGAFSDLSSF